MCGPEPEEYDAADAAQERAAQESCGAKHCQFGCKKPVSLDTPLAQAFLAALDDPGLD